MKFYLTVAGMLLLSLLRAQFNCGSTEALDKWFASHPDHKASFLQHQAQLTESTREAKVKFRSAAAASASTFTIPVVFHILHMGGGENISDAQVKDAMRILNEDYNLLNADTGNVVAAFKPIVGNTSFRFELAKLDPSGNCTNGIIRHWDPNTAWPMVDFNAYKYTWDPIRYMNVYVVKSVQGGNVAGYTFLPGSGIPSDGDAIVMLSHYVGSVGSSNPASSRVLTHEVGHWFSLEHTWGFTNLPGVACGDDGVSDTPVTKGWTNCSLGFAIDCNPGVTENIQNYMEYAYCGCMFTAEQSLRMQQAASSPISGRDNLTTPANLALTGVTGVPPTVCLPGLEIALPEYTVCAGRPIAVTAYTHNAAPQSYAWSATGAIISAAGAPTTTIVFTTPGTSTVSCTASNGAGSVSSTMIVHVMTQVADISKVNTEGFETGFLPGNWNTFGSDSSVAAWTVDTDGSFNGNHAIFVPAETYSPFTTAVLETPSYNFRNNPGSIFTFWYSYAKKDNSYKDVFRVQASSDCGATWKDIWVPYMNTVAMNSGSVTGTLLKPKKSPWAFYNLTLHPNFFGFLKEENVRIRFIFTEDENGTGAGNRFYLDDINFQPPVGVNAYSQQLQLDVYPNPNSGEVTLRLRLPEDAAISWQLLDVSGQLVRSSQGILKGHGEQTVSVTTNGELAAGIYFLNVDVNGVVVSRKIVVAR